jgi:putative endonuclease
MEQQTHYTVYILYSPKHRKIYIGCTSHLINRFKSHNLLAQKGWTSHFRPWVVILAEVYYTKSDALHRESQLKQANSRTAIWQKIEQMFETQGFITL